MKAKLIEAQYVQSAQSVLLLLEHEGTQQRTQIHRNDLAKFGRRTNKEIDDEMERYVFTLNKIYRGKEIEITKGKE